MRWEIGDKLRILHCGVLDAQEHVTEDGEYDVVAIDNDGTPIIEGSYGNRVYFYPDEMQYVERASMDYDEGTSYGEIGESIKEMREELADIKAMIGRLLRNGGDEE